MNCKYRKLQKYIYPENICFFGFITGNTLHKSDDCNDNGDYVNNNDIEMDLQEVGWEHELNRSGSGYGHVAGTCK
jgi:hypothetical protein